MQPAASGAGRPTLSVSDMEIDGCSELDATTVGNEEVDMLASRARRLEGWIHSISRIPRASNKPRSSTFTANTPSKYCRPSAHHHTPSSTTYLTQLRREPAPRAPRVVPSQERRKVLVVKRRSLPRERPRQHHVERHPHRPDVVHILALKLHLPQRQTVIITCCTHIPAARGTPAPPAPCTAAFQTR